MLYRVGVVACVMLMGCGTDQPSREALARELANRARYMRLHDSLAREFVALAEEGVDSPALLLPDSIVAARAKAEAAQREYLQHVTEPHVFGCLLAVADLNHLVERDYVSAARSRTTGDAAGAAILLDSVRRNAVRVHAALAEIRTIESESIHRLEQRSAGRHPPDAEVPRVDRPAACAPPSHTVRG